jgi:phage FluMu protein Com
MAVTFPCTNCKKVLRSAAAPPPGKKVKCPACGGLFLPVVKDAEATEATAVSTKPSAKPAMAKTSAAAAPAKKRRAEDDEEAEELPKKKKRPVSDMDEDDEDDRPKKKRRLDDEDDDTPKSRKGRRDDDDEDDDDRPRKGKKKKSGSNMGLILALAGGGVGLLVIFGLTAFVWPGFLTGGGGGGAAKGGLAVGGIEPLAMMPADATVIAGLKPGKIDKKATDAIVKGGFFGPGKDAEEVMNLGLSADRIVASLNMIQKKFVVVLFFSGPADQERFKKQLNAEPAQQIGGQMVHVCKSKTNEKGFLCFVTDRVVCFGSTPTDQEFAQLLANKSGQSKLSPDATRLIDKVASSDSWLVFTPDDATRNEINSKTPKTKGKGGADPTEVAMKTVLDSKGVSLGVTDVAGSYSLSVSLLSKSADEAGKTKNMIDTYLSQGKELLNAFGAFKKINSIKNDVEKMNVQSQGEMVSANISISPASINEMQTLAGEMMGGMPGGGFGPGGPPPGGINPPPGGFVPPGGIPNPKLPPFPKKR